MRYLPAMLLLSCLLMAGSSAASDTEIGTFIRTSAIALEQEADIFPVFRGAGEKKLVLLGEASHGTSEYYTWRTTISKHLITRYGYNFIAVEGDWPSAYPANLYVKGLPGAAETAEKALDGFERWPHWMWRNREVVALLEWLKDFNSTRPPDQRVGVYGVDLQNKHLSIDAILSRLRQHDPKLARRVEKKYECLRRFQAPGSYAQAVAGRRADCSAPAERAYELIASAREQLPGLDDQAFFDVYHNARLVKHAERQARSQVQRGPESWNHRARHFQYTADALLAHYGDQSKGIVWAHNTHIGDARATDMRRFGMVNIGQLAREAYGKDRVFAVGFGSYGGEVLAGRTWGARRETMTLPEAREGSWEAFMHGLAPDVCALVFDEYPESLAARAFPHRAVGVTYRPEAEAANYVPTVIPQRYDAFIFFRTTRGLHPLEE